MKKKVKVWIGVGSVFFILLVWAVASRVSTREQERSSAISLTPEQRAALAYGEEHQDELLVDFQKPWTLFLGYESGLGQAIIYTPFHTLALITRNALQNGLDIDTATLCRLAAQEAQTVRFEVFLYGNESGFDKGYQAEVAADGKIFKPLKVFFAGYDQAREYTITARYHYYFPLEILKAKRIILRIVRPNEAPLEFPFRNEEGDLWPEK